MTQTQTMANAAGLVRLDAQESARRKQGWIERITAQADFWVFGYGSLMWKQGFPFVECRPARVAGVRRAFCVWSHNYRGSAERPGLVLGLARLDGAAGGAECAGRAFRIADCDRAAVIDYLWEREMNTGIYEPQLLEASTPGGPLPVHAFVVDGAHRQYAGHLTEEERARLIALAEGCMGPNRDYLFNTVAQLHEIGLADPDLSALADRVRRILAEGAS